MTSDQRMKKTDELSEQIAGLKAQLAELQHETILADQQDCLDFVGRAFKNDNEAILITSVPVITLTMHGESFNKYQYPCIKVSLQGHRPPIFDDTFFLTKEVLYEYTEIPIRDFKEILDKRVEKLVMLAATAKLRQQGVATKRLR